MYEELIKRLREAPYDWYDADLHYKAADVIEEFQERVAVSEAIIKRQSDIIKVKDRDLQQMINATSRTFEPITNQEAMSRLTPEEFYRKMYWLMFNYGRQFNSTELAVIEWLKQEAKEQCEKDRVRSALK